MAGISSKAAGKLENRFKYNGGNELQSGEWSDGSGLEVYDAVHRMYDPQLGRFFQIDKLSELSIDATPYGFARNNPILMNDPLGLKEDTLQGSSSIVLAPSSRKQVASKAMNQMDYGQIAAWVDMKRQKGNSIETIQNWALGNRYLEQNTLHKLLDATNPNSLAIRSSQEKWWKVEGGIFETLLALMGGEVLALADVEILSKVLNNSKYAVDLVAVKGNSAIKFAFTKNIQRFGKISFRQQTRKILYDEEDSKFRKYI
jgi:RHS repeat-associated protein